MTTFAENQWFEVFRCFQCGMAFAMTTEYVKRRRDDHKTWCCPEGHDQYFPGKSEAEKLREQLVGKDREITQANTRAARLTSERNQIAKAHKRMRQRVTNGVCPCCTRSFDNLRAHMKTKHPEFGNEQTVKALREAFGMTQGDVAAEAGVRFPHYVSLYERGKPVPVEARQNLDWWLESQAGAA